MKKPNVVLINCDDMGYGDLECYGSTLNKTPAIDRLASEGTRFTDFSMASPACSPSRGAMLTGCYPSRIGFATFHGAFVLYPGHDIGLAPTEVTIADILKQNGYRTKMIGKWHCGDQPEFLPLNHGFDEYYGIPFSNDMGRQNDDRVQFPPLPLVKDNKVIQQQPDQRGLTERYTEQALEFIEKSNAEDSPFFIYLAHLHVHLPLYAAERFVKESVNGDYGACVAAVDWSTSCIMHKLEGLGIADNTIVIFTSDNGSRGVTESENPGTGSNGPLRGAKGQTWEGGLRVPCIVRWPGQIPAGRVCGEFVTGMDFLPTITALCSAEYQINHKIDGLDLSALWTGQTDTSCRETFFYYRYKELEAVRRKEWKLHVRKNNQDVQLLFNLHDDIAEQNNLYDQYPEIVAQLEALLEECRTELGDGVTGAKGNGVRPIGKVENAKTMTEYDPDHPYIMAMYDKGERG